MAKVVLSVNMDETLWALLKTEADRRGISKSALLSILVADSLRPNKDATVELFRSLSTVATLGLAPWKQERKPSV